MPYDRTKLGPFDRTELLKHEGQDSHEGQVAPEAAVLGPMNGLKDGQRMSKMVKGW